MSEQHSTASLDPITSEHSGLIKVAHMQVRFVQMGKGHLKIYTRTVHGVPVMEAFTLQSLADCMGMAPGTMEGRYNRGRLFNWKVDIPTGESRPVRGFPLALLEQVMTILTTRGARVEGAGTNEESVGNSGVSGRARYELQYETHGGHKYITIPALARHYNVSVTTIRNKLSRSGLLPMGVNLTSPAQGGRPRRGFPASMYDKLVDAIENGAQFFNECQTVYSRVMFSGVHTRAPADVAPHPDMILPKLPTGNPEASTRTPSADVLDMVGQLEGMLARAKPPAGQAPNPVTTKLDQWADKLHAARDKVWEFDSVIDQMRKAGLSDGEINEAVTMQYTRPSVNDAERSAGGAA